MPSFDAVCEPNVVELKNAIEQANKEISNRFDFKGSDSRVEQKDETLILFGDDDFKLGQVRDVLFGKMAKRNVDVRYLKDDKKETIGSDKRKQTMKIQKGITQELAKKVVRIIKDSKVKVQASIQGDAVRVTGGKRDDLQETMALLKKEVTEAPLGFNNFRDWCSGEYCNNHLRLRYMYIMIIYINDRLWLYCWISVGHRQRL